MPRALKVLQINKFFYLRGGAERQMFDISRLLEKHGHTVINFSMRDERNLPSLYENYFAEKVDLEKFSLKNILKFFWNYDAVNKLEKLIKDQKPDIAHLHNIAHQLSPAIISVLKKYNLPVIQTLHDYKLICPNYLLFSQNEICQKCGQGKYYNCWLRKCLKGSGVKSFLAMLEAYWQSLSKIYDQIDLFISPSNFMRDVCLDFGVPVEKIRVIYNFVDESLADAPESGNSQDEYFLYFGRLSPEKGIEVLIKAWQTLNAGGCKLKITGDGPSRERLIGLIKNLKLEQTIEMTGPKYGQELKRIIRGAKAVVLPSLWPENLPYSLLEALALKKVVICSRVGGMPEIIQDGVNGFTFTPGGAEELAQKMRYLLNHSEIKEKAEINAFNSSKIINDQEKFYDSLIGIYDSILKL